MPRGIAMSKKPEEIINEWVNSLSEEQKNNLVKAVEQPLKDLSKFGDELKGVLEPSITHLAECIPEYTSEDVLPKYEGINMELIHNKFPELSNKDIGIAIGVSESSLSKYNSLITPIPVEKAIQLSSVTGISLDLLLKQKERKIDDNFTANYNNIVRYNLKTREKVNTEEEFNILKNIPANTNLVSFYCFDESDQMFGMDVRPIHIVDRSFDNERIKERKAFLGMLRIDNKTVIKQVTPGDRYYSIQVGTKINKYTKAQLENMFIGVVLKTIIDY